MLFFGTELFILLFLIWHHFYTLFRELLMRLLIVLMGSDYGSYANKNMNPYGLKMEITVIWSCIQNTLDISDDSYQRLRSHHPKDWVLGEVWIIRLNNPEEVLISPKSQGRVWKSQERAQIAETNLRKVLIGQKNRNTMNSNSKVLIN